MEPCVFCQYAESESETVLFENEHCVCFQQNEPVLAGSCVIVPKAHKETVFDLSAQEREATGRLLEQAKRFLDETYRPDEYNVGWNVGAAGGQFVFHAHLHVIPRHKDEPLAGKGIRHWIKQAENARPTAG